jgi:3-oxoacyl-[acyl-carrier protein] reductase
MDLNLRGKLALVTGASKGIGKAIALQLAREGASVILVARTKAALEALHEEMPKAAEGHYVMPVDLMQEGGVADLVKQVKERLREPDIIVHNLGGSLAVPTMSSVDDWQKVWFYNVGIVHALNLAFIPGMRERKWGRIVCLSTLSTRTFNGYPPYVSAKCALDGYIKSVCREVARDNVIISGVAPGAIYSEGRHFAKLQKENPAALEEYFKNHLPTWRLGTGQDIAPVVAYLCSDQAAFMAGSIVGIDGGAA